MKIVFKNGQILDLEDPDDLNISNGTIILYSSSYVLKFERSEILYAENYEGFKMSF